MPARWRILGSISVAAVGGFSVRALVLNGRCGDGTKISGSQSFLIRLQRFLAQKPYFGTAEASACDMARYRVDSGFYGGYFFSPRQRFERSVLRRR